MMVEVEPKTALDTEKLVFQARSITIVRADDLVVPHAQGRLAAIRTVPTCRPDMLHLPWTGLIAISVRSQRADRADIDTGAALIAIQLVAKVRRDLTVDTAVHHAERIHPQAFIADAHASIAKNAAGRVVV